MIDDVPTATADTDSVTEGGSTSGDVLTNDELGADRAEVDGSEVTGIASVNEGTSDTTADGSGDFTLAGEYGTLTLNQDGTYTYVANADVTDADVEDVFTYTITDGDGDTSTTTLTIDVNNVTLVADNQEATVNEAALDTTADDRDGTINDDLAAGVVDGSDPTSDAETVSGQLNVTGAVSYTLDSFSGNNGEFNLNEDGSWTYTLTDPVDGADADDGTNTFTGVETITYTCLLYTSDAADD